MRREDFTLTVSRVQWVSTDDTPEQPLVRINCHGADAQLVDRLTGPDGELLTNEETDVAFRLHDSIDDDDPAGVVSVTNRITGSFVLELNESAADVLQFIQAAREYGATTESGDGTYQVEIYVDDEPLVTYEKSTFLIYDPDGNLLRSQSLIPSGIEL